MSLTVTPEFGVKLPKILNRSLEIVAKYDLIDPELYAWAAKHGLQIFTNIKMRKCAQLMLWGVLVKNVRFG